MILAIAAFAILSTQPHCKAVTALDKPGHISLGVNAKLGASTMRELTAALNRWSKIIDMDWHYTDGSDCTLSVRLDPSIHRQYDNSGYITYALTEMWEPNLPTWAGKMYLNDKQEITEEILFHELAHAFGLDHNDDITSAMYPNIQDKPSFTLTAAELKFLAKYRGLRCTQ